MRLFAIYHKYARHTWLVIVSELGAITFTTKGSNDMSLKDIIQSPYILRGIWDARNNAAGQLREFGIKPAGIEPAGIEDVQFVICMATEFKYQCNRPKLEVAIEKFCEMSKEVNTKMTNTKEAGKRYGNRISAVPSMPSTNVRSAR